MSDSDAEARFRLGMSQLREIDRRLDEFEIDDLSTRDVDAAVADLDAAIEGLSGLALGRALLLRAHAADLRLTVTTFADAAAGKNFADIRRENDSDNRWKQAALQDAERGRDLVAAAGETTDLDWADRLIALLKS
jgi:hypothetical protein